MLQRSRIERLEVFLSSQQGGTEQTEVFFAEEREAAQQEVKELKLLLEN